MANIVRRLIAAKLPPNVGVAIEKVGRLREMLRGVAPGREEGPERMRWIVKVSDVYSLEELCEMEEGDMETLLGFYRSGEVPRLACLRAMEGRFTGFDGSFGFYVG